MTIKKFFLTAVLALFASFSNAAEYEQQHYSFALLSDSLGSRPGFFGEITWLMVSGPDDPGISLTSTSFASGTGYRGGQVRYSAGEYPLVTGFFDYLTIYQTRGFRDITFTVTNNRYLLTDVWTNRPEFNKTDMGVLAFTSTVPIPEPETYVLMMSGIGAVVFAVRRRRQQLS